MPNEIREIEARFSSVGTCGHDIAKGDIIGWKPGRYPRGRRAGEAPETLCADCWAKSIQTWRENDPTLEFQRTMRRHRDNAERSLQLTGGRSDCEYDS